MTKVDVAGAVGRRRTWICVAAGAGSFLIAASITMATYGANELKVIPLNVQSDTTSIAPAASVLNGASVVGPGRVVTDSNVDLTISTYVTTEEPVSSELTTLQAAQRTYRADIDPEAGLVSASVDRVTIDRRSGAPVADPVATTQSEANAPATETPREGFQYKFPFDVEKASYPYYDGTARVTSPIEFVDDDRVVDGMTLFHFSQTVGPTDLGATIGNAATLTLPASKWGLPGEEATTMNLHYENTRDVWVEPVSGSIVAVEEQPHRWLAQTLDDPNAVTTLDARTAFSEDTVARLAEQAKNARSQILWGTRYGPIAGAVVGLALLLGAASLGLKWTREGRRALDGLRGRTTQM